MAGFLDGHSTWVFLRSTATGKEICLQYLHRFIRRYIRLVSPLITCFWYIQLLYRLFGHPAGRDIYYFAFDTPGFVSRHIAPWVVCGRGRFPEPAISSAAWLTQLFLNFNAIELMCAPVVLLARRLCQDESGMQTQAFQCICLACVYGVLGAFVDSHFKYGIWLAVGRAWWVLRCYVHDAKGEIAGARKSRKQRFPLATLARCAGAYYQVGACLKIARRIRLQYVKSFAVWGEPFQTDVPGAGVMLQCCVVGLFCFQIFVFDAWPALGSWFERGLKAAEYCFDSVILVHMPLLKEAGPRFFPYLDISPSLEALNNWQAAAYYIIFAIISLPAQFLSNALNKCAYGVWCSIARHRQPKPKRSFVTLLGCCLNLGLVTLHAAVVMLAGERRGEHIGQPIIQWDAGLKKAFRKHFTNWGFRQ